MKKKTEARIILVPLFFQAVKNYPLIIISFMDTDSGLEKEVVFDVPNQVERDKLIQILTELAKPFETGFESNIPGLMTRKKSLSVRDIL